TQAEDHFYHIVHRSLMALTGCWTAAQASLRRSAPTHADRFLTRRRTRFLQDAARILDASRPQRLIDPGPAHPREVLDAGRHEPGHQAVDHFPSRLAVDVQSAEHVRGDLTFVPVDETGGGELPAGGGH